LARVALIGSNGQLGSDLTSAWPASFQARRGDELVGLTHADLDVTNDAAVRSVLGGISPALVINTAAFHRVDECETQVKEAFRVNVFAVATLARVCRELGAVLVHFSTDYVFSGTSTRPYEEDDPTGPLSAYGISKVAGEHFLRYLLPDAHVLVRSSGLYGVAGASGKGGNFVETMLRLAADGRPIRVVDDQRLTPTATADLARALLLLLAKGGRGTFHITNQGDCTWADFARAIFDLCRLRPDFAPVTSEEFGSPARRPAYSVLANKRLMAIGVEQPRHWREALKEYLRAKGHLAV
jgi:dTDP-4-dehydrorhamnose reductase